MGRKKSYRRRNSKFQALPVNIDISLGTLGAGVVTSAPLTGLGTTRFRVVSADLEWSISDKTAAEGPIEVGISNGELSNTEIAEKLDASPTSQSDIVAREQARRPVRRSGKFVSNAVSEVLNNGRAIRTKLITVLDEGVELEAWVRNGDGSALTTGAEVQVNGTVYGYWI